MVDLFAGEGNLILPLLVEFNQDQRINFFKDHIFLLRFTQKWSKNALITRFLMESLKM